MTDLEPASIAANAAVIAMLLWQRDRARMYILGINVYLLVYTVARRLIDG